MNMIERVAWAIDAVQIWSRFNDWTNDRVEGLPVEICRYGSDGEPEIVVLKRIGAVEDAGDALREVISEMRARAAIEAMRGPTEAMCAAGSDAHGVWGFGAADAGPVFDAMIDAALSEAQSTGEKP